MLPSVSSAQCAVILLVCVDLLSAKKDDSIIIIGGNGQQSGLGGGGGGMSPIIMGGDGKDKDGPTIIFAGGSGKGQDFGGHGGGHGGGYGRGFDGDYGGGGYDGSGNGGYDGGHQEGYGQFMSSYSHQSPMAYPAPMRMRMPMREMDMPIIDMETYHKLMKPKSKKKKSKKKNSNKQQQDSNEYQRRMRPAMPVLPPAQYPYMSMPVPTTPLMPMPGHMHQPPPHPMMGQPMSQPMSQHMPQMMPHYNTNAMMQAAPSQQSYDVPVHPSYSMTSGGNMMTSQSKAYQNFFDNLPPIIVKIPAPIINVPAPIVNVPPAVVNVSVPPIHVPQAVVNVPTPKVNVPTPIIKVAAPKINVPPAIVNVPVPVINVPDTISITKEAIKVTDPPAPTTREPQYQVVMPDEEDMPTRAPKRVYRASPTPAPRSRPRKKKGQNLAKQMDAMGIDMSELVMMLGKMKSNRKQNSMVDDIESPSGFYDGGNLPQDPEPDDLGDEMAYQRKNQFDYDSDNQRAKSNSNYGVNFQEETSDSLKRRKQFADQDDDMMMYQDQTFVPTYVDPGQDGQVTYGATYEDDKAERTLSIDVNIYDNRSEKMAS
ncbi:hypothetical protein HDE_08655 [Halotydeus destructor]|nr:hypothetical protein HDE_08655 [Halotydeus destructor]